MPAVWAQNQNNQGQDNQGQDGVPRLDHVFVIVLENHNSFTSFSSNGIIGNPQAPNITALCFSLLKTIEAAFGLPFLGHAADATTNTLAPLLTPAEQ
jgi:hypothetical protein